MEDCMSESEARVGFSSSKDNNFQADDDNSIEGNPQSDV